MEPGPSTEWDSADVRRWRRSPTTPRAAPALIAAIGVSSALDLLPMLVTGGPRYALQPFLAARRNAANR